MKEYIGFAIHIVPMWMKAVCLYDAVKIDLLQSIWMLFLQQFSFNIFLLFDLVYEYSTDWNWLTTSINVNHWATWIKLFFSTILEILWEQCTAFSLTRNKKHTCLWWAITCSMYVWWKAGRKKKIQINRIGTKKF